MKVKVDPKEFSLPGKTVIEQIFENHLALVVSRKSRIIMKDGLNILHQADMIKSVMPGVKVSLMTSAPVCSKTIKFLGENNVDIIPVGKNCPMVAGMNNSK